MRFAFYILEISISVKLKQFTLVTNSILMLCIKLLQEKNLFISKNILVKIMSHIEH